MVVSSHRLGGGMRCQSIQGMGFQGLDFLSQGLGRFPKRALPEAPSLPQGGSDHLCFLALPLRYYSLGVDRYRFNCDSHNRFCPFS